MLATMQPTRPALRVDVTGSKKSAPPSSYVSTAADDTYTQSNISIFRSSNMEIHVHSPSVKVVEGRASHSLPVFGDHDKIGGTVHLDPKLASTAGRLTISMEGTFVYVSPKLHDDDESTLRRKPRHVFFTSSVVHPCGDNGSPRSTTSLRGAFAASMRSVRLDRRPSLQDMTGSRRQVFQFAFDVPPPSRPGEEMPPTFSSVVMTGTEARGRTGVERAEVEYKVVALWEGADPSEQARLEAPILLQPDTDFQSLDGLSLEPESWLEIPLRSDRPIPFKCAITLPVPSTFPRSASIPYFVVFTTKPRSPLLAREIAVDATVSVSLLRQVTIVTNQSSPHSSFHSTSTSLSSSNSDDSDAPSSSTRKFLRRMAKSTPISQGHITPSESRRQRKHSHTVKDKPLPDLPPNPGLLETRTLHTDMSIGFPKRPRNRVEPNETHPSLDAHSSLPDGLYKGSMQLNKSMLPSIDWAGLSVKYFLEVSVLFNQDELRARIPIRIF
ncbi:unnamed protein product [Somion occarium]|uniref:Arrestin-like N-terminal domain-containing protein n=1 Tax=Somion occarium TaxID=3059160 RepID=A0ABP1CVA3_9APHY